MSNENRVQFNLKNVHYAVLSSAGTSPAWATPVHVPGAVTLTLDPQGEVTPFYADGVVYYQTVSNNGYSGSLELARVPDKMLQDIWGYTLGETSKVLTEHADVQPAAFALLYQIDGDADNELYVMYNCSASRPGAGAATSTETREPQTRSFDLSAAPLPLDGVTHARTTAQTPASTRSGWFDAVYKEGAAG